jgi:outer membrane protein OmpA-like peptidoglycan-associated protein
MSARSWLAAGVLTAALAGCATVPVMVPQSLLDARTALQLAQKDHADLLVPEDFQTARHELDKAESSFAAEHSLATIEDLAFEALADAQIAQANARRRQAEAEFESVQQALATQQSMLIALMQKNQALSAAAQKLQASLADRAAADQKAVAAQAAKEEEARLRAAAEREAEMLRKAQAIKNAQVTREARGLVINLSGKVLFDSGSSRLQQGALSQLDQVAELVKDYPDYRVKIEGHTDSTGDLLANNTLSQARAESVLNYLNQKGISLDNLQSVGLGPTRPLATNATPAGRQLNRRVEIILERKAEKAVTP